MKINLIYSIYKYI